VKCVKILQEVDHGFFTSVGLEVFSGKNLVSIIYFFCLFSLNFRFWTCHKQPVWTGSKPVSGNLRKFDNTIHPPLVFVYSHFYHSSSRVTDRPTIHIVLDVQAYLVTEPFPALGSSTLEDPDGVTSIQVSVGVTLGTFGGYHPFFDPFDIYLVDLSKILWITFFNHFFYFPKAYDKFVRALTIIGMVVLAFSYIHSSKMYVLVTNKLLRTFMTSKWCGLI